MPTARSLGAAQGYPAVNEPPVSLILSKLPNARRNGFGWIALCPAHEDGNPSLSVSEGEDGRVLLHCYAGCSADEVCGALGIRVSLLFPRDDTRAGTSPLRHAARQRGLRGVLQIRLGANEPSRGDMKPLAELYRASLDPGRLEGFAQALGVSVESLDRLHVGWSAEHQAWSFPMTDVRDTVLGIRLRRPGGSKFAVKGSREGLFVPNSDVRDGQGRSRKGSSQLLIVEGPTDTAALLEMGFEDVVGRPSCTGATSLLIELVRNCSAAEVVIVADADAPGRRGANSLASILVAYARSVRVIEPPRAINDARGWLQAGGVRIDVEKAIEAAPVRRLTIRTE